MILVVSNVANEAADDLVGMFPSGAASLVTASNFNATFRAGISVSDFQGSEIILGGRAIRPSEISGVIATIPYFHPQEFYYIEPADQAYVCAELSAFLIYFLSELACPKLNPPSSRTLSGLGMQRVEWYRAAQSCGVPVMPMRLRNGVRELGDETREMRLLVATLVGDTLVGSGTPETVARHMRTLSLAFGMPYLSCAFATQGDTYQLAELSSVPDISVRENRDAILGYMGRAA